MIETSYRVTDPSFNAGDLLAMADMVARRCPVFATLRKSTRIKEYLFLNDQLTATRHWNPGHAAAVAD
jgi:hypothetical protein